MLFNKKLEMLTLKNNVPPKIVAPYFLATTHLEVKDGR